LIFYASVGTEVKMAGLPSGTVTFLFTDLEHSSELWERHPEAMRAALARHDAILVSAVADNGGHVVKGAGDGVLAVFPAAAGALAAAIGAQLQLGGQWWGDTGPLLVRMALHTGEAEERAGDYFGPALNRAARLMALAHGGQVLASRATESVLRDRLPDEVELLDLGERRLNSLARPERVFQVTHRELRRDFPPLRSADRRPGNLPPQLTSFVGRELESEQVVATLGRARVVTLTGVGGVGKTRLALHVAGMVTIAERFPDGCWLCELAALREGEAVPDALVTALGVEPGRGATVTETLVDFLREKELLLVLDNCEHLLQPVGQLVARVLQSCPRVQVLATSREGLGVAGEWILAVRSLGIADAGAGLDAVRSCEAVRLFSDRARAVKADFVVDSSNAEAVAQVCRRLDGIPLAIELAASRTTALSAGELARRLDDRFRVLGGAQRAMVERHQTLRAAIDWSYELLGQQEQALFERVSVFSGGFTLDAAEVVTSGEGIAAGDVLELLASLVARSLVVASTSPTETRFAMYETIRQYAQEQLDRRGATDGLRQRHAEHYARFAESVARAHARAPNDYESDAELDREVDNLRAAFTWAVDSRDGETALRLLGNVNTLGMSAVSLAFRPLSELALALALPRTSDHPDLPAALAAAAWYAHQRDDQELALRRVREAVEAAERLCVELEPWVWSVHAFIAMSRGAIDEQIDYLGRAAAAYRARGDAAGLAVALGQRAVGHTLRGETAAAANDAEEALAVGRRLRARGATVAVLSVAAYGLADSDPERALVLLNEAIDINASLGRPHGPMWGVAGRIASRLGNRHDALRFSARALEQSHRIGARPVLGPLVRRVGDLLVPDDPETAAVLHGASGTGYPSSHLEEAHLRAVADLDAVLGETRRQALTTRGTALNLDDAVALACEAVNRVIGPDAEDAIGPTGEPNALARRDEPS
jgi:predicted ATPase/class 3 adenylate cyclase